MRASDLHESGVDRRPCCTATSSPSPSARSPLPKSLTRPQQQPLPAWLRWPLPVKSQPVLPSSGSAVAASCVVGKAFWWPRKNFHMEALTLTLQTFLLPSMRTPPQDQRRLNVQEVQPWQCSANTCTCCGCGHGVPTLSSCFHHCDLQRGQVISPVDAITPRGLVGKHGPPAMWRENASSKGSWVVPMTNCYVSTFISAL